MGKDVNNKKIYLLLAIITARKVRFSQIDKIP